MNPDLKLLQPYPFEKLASLTADISPNPDLAPISLSIGEPRHPVPPVILDAYRNALEGIGKYPNTLGSQALREAIINWLINRFHLSDKSINSETHVLPVNGTREALFAFAQTVIDRSTSPLVVMPNPCYQIYEGATYLAGAQPHYLPCTSENDFLPDLDAVPDRIWQQCQLIYLCSPGNPTGAVTPESQLRKLIELAQRHDFVIASDECYSEIFPDEGNPPPGLLQVAHDMGLSDFKRCIVFHSLSKRSNVPGMRSGFVAGDAAILEKFRKYRTYHGSTMSPAVQEASIAAWADEKHVRENREQYRQKYRVFGETLADLIDTRQPAGSFYLWPKLPVSELDFTRRLLAEQNVRIVPGSYLGREIDGANPGSGHVRISLVAEVEECAEAARRIRNVLNQPIQ